MHARTWGIITAVVLMLIMSAFVGGMYVGEGKIPAVAQVAGLINKDGDALTQQVGAETLDFAPYWRVWNVLEHKWSPFGTSTDAEQSAKDRMYASIEGLVSSYHDPYTVFMRPQLAEEFKIATRGSLEGIGAVIGERDGGLVVVGPLPSSPAERAGLVSGDNIVKIDAREAAGLSVDEAVNLIRGPGGTDVVLTIQSVDEEPREVTITRGTIEIPSTAHVVVARDVPQKVATADGGTVETGETEQQDFYVLRLFNFSQTSIAAFERELHAFVENGSRSLIIDLRGNPGGYLEAAVKMASWFLPRGSVVVRDFTGPEKHEKTYVTGEDTIFTQDNMPRIAILVDRSSASASEILAGALQEHGVAKLIGTRTFGKGSVQELVNITDELALKVTVSRWYTPNGRSISDGGLTPDIEIDPTSATSSDPWLEAAIDYLSE